MIGISLILTTLAAAPAEAVEIPFTPGVTFRLATLEEGRAAIAQRDDFTSALSKLDVQVRLQTDQKSTAEDYIKFVTPHVTQWQDDERAKLARVAAKLRDRLAALEISPPFPAKILIVRTSGLDESHAAYTRGQAVFLPASKVGLDEAGLERLLAHELFHVLSRNAPQLRRRLYALVGYHSCPPVELPPEWRDRKLTNPDAPHLDSAIELEHNGEKIKAVSFLYVRDPNYRPKPGDSLFRLLDFKLLAIEVRDNVSHPKLVEGQPLLIDPRSSQSFQKQIGQNTGYIIHPDEILADNFQHLLLGTPGLKTPELIAKLKDELKKP